MEQIQVFAGGITLIQVDDQHAVVTDPGELVSRIAGNQAGTHAAHLATASADLEFRTADQRHHQLVVIVSMHMGLVIQANQTGLKHR